MSFTNISDQASSAMWIVPCQYGTGADAAKLNAVGTAVKLVSVQDGDIDRPVGTTLAKKEYIQSQLGNGVTREVLKRSITVDSAGSVKAASGDAALHKFVANVLENDVVSFNNYVALENIANGGYLIICVPLGDTNAGGFAYLLCQLTGSIKKKLSGNATNPIPLNFDGVSETVLATAAFTHTIINTAITAITQPGTGVALHPTTAGTTFALEAADIAVLLSGKWVVKPANA